MAQAACISAASSGRSSSSHRTDDLLAVGQQPVAVERRVVVDQHRPERLRHRRRIEQLVLDDVDALEERLDGREQPVARIETTQIEPRRLPGEKGGELVVVQHVVRLVPRHPLLQQPEAERVDRADEQPGHAVQSLPTQPLLDPMGDAVLQLVRGPLGERERDDSLGATPSASRSATRWETTSVFPEPADAMICRWPPRWRTASRAALVSSGVGRELAAASTANTVGPLGSSSNSQSSAAATSLAQERRTAGPSRARSARTPEG